MVFMNSILPKTQSYWQPLSFASSLQWFCGVREGAHTSGDLTVVCHFASIPTEQPLLHVGGKGWNIWQGIFPQSHGNWHCLVFWYALCPPTPEREHWQGFVFCTPPPVIHVAAEGDRRGINIASSEPKLLRAYFVLNKITLSKAVCQHLKFWLPCLYLERLVLF